MKTEQKAQLIAKLKQAIADSGLSNNRFADERLGITKGMLSQVLNNWQSDGIVGENTWNIIIKYLGNTEDYKMVDTDNFKKVVDACVAAYSQKVFVPIIGEGGYGKSVGFGWYKQHQEAIKGHRVYYVNCEGVSTRKQLYTLILQVLGVTADGTVKKQIADIKHTLEKQDCLLQIDEVSALKDHLVVAIKDLMTALKGICGIAFAGTPYFINNLNKGANKSKHLYSETRDRLFMVHYTLNAPTDQEAERIFQANDVSGEALTIVMGKHKNPQMKQFAWRNKPTFRGIYDCIGAIRLAFADNQINIPSTFTL
jgi:Cdc6-like AAA superfamily ATPase